MDVNFLPGSLPNQGSGATNVLANLNVTEKIDSSNSMSKGEQFSVKFIHWLYSPKCFLADVINFLTGVCIPPSLYFH